MRLFAILSPVGPYFKAGFNPIKLYADTENVRAWPGGTGNAKVFNRVIYGVFCVLFIVVDGYMVAQLC